MKTSERRRAAIARIQLQKQFEKIAQQFAEKRVLRTLFLFLGTLAVLTVVALLAA
jgi:hypothetical protein